MPILAHQLKPAEFVRTVLAALVPPETKPEDVLHPEYWVHVQRSLKTGDRIEVQPESAEWLLVLLVRAVPAEGVVVTVLHKHVFDETPAAADDAYEVKFSGGAKWRVIRKADRQVMVENLPTREAASKWKADNLKTDLV
jgi:hypothetical protein